MGGKAYSQSSGGFVWVEQWALPLYSDEQEMTKPMMSHSALGETGAPSLFTESDNSGEQLPLRYTMQCSLASGSIGLPVLIYIIASIRYWNHGMETNRYRLRKLKYRPFVRYELRRQGGSINSRIPETGSVVHGVCSPGVSQTNRHL